jgi:hypothetical protein
MRIIIALLSSLIMSQSALANSVDINFTGLPAQEIYKNLDLPEQSYGKNIYKEGANIVCFKAKNNQSFDICYQKINPFTGASLEIRARQFID